MSTTDTSRLIRCPLLSSFLIWLVTAPGMMLGTTLLFVLGSGLQLPLQSAGPFCLRGALTLWFVLMLRRQGWLSAAGFNAFSQWREPRLVLIPALLILLNLSNLLGQDLVANPDWTRMAAGLADGFSIALFEETAYRGLILVILLRHFHASRAQVIGAVLGSSLLFGLYHLPTNSYWQMNVSQIVYTTCLGIGFAAVMLRTRSIWWTVAVHTLIYTSSIVADVLLGGTGIQLGEGRELPDPSGVALRSVLALLPMALYGLYLLRNCGRPGRQFPPWRG